MGAASRGGDDLYGCAAWPALGGGEKAAEVRAMGEHELQVSGCAVAVRWQWAAADVSDWVCEALRILMEFSSYPMGFAMRKTMARK